MPDFPDLPAIANDYIKFFDKPTPQNRLAVRRRIAPFLSETPTDFSAAAQVAVSALDNAYATVGQIHASSIQAANMIGADIQTLGGGNTPDAQ